MPVARRRPGDVSARRRCWIRSATVRDPPAGTVRTMDAARPPPGAHPHPRAGGRGDGPRAAGDGAGWRGAGGSTAAPHLLHGDSLEIDASTCVVALFGRPRTAALHLNKGACSALKVLCPHSLPQGPLLAVAWLSIKAGTGGRRGPTPRSMAANTRRTRPGPQPRLPGQGDRGAVRPPARVRAVKTRAKRL